MPTVWAPSSRAVCLPPAVREAGKQNAEGLSAKLTEGVKERRRFRAAVCERFNYSAGMKSGSSPVATTMPEM